MDQAKIEVIGKFPPPFNIKGIRSFLRHSSFYRRFINDFSKIIKPLFRVLQHDLPYVSSEECEHAFKTLKKSLISTPIVKAPDWTKLFDLMCDASDFSIGAVLGQRHNKSVSHNLLC